MGTAAGIDDGLGRVGDEIRAQLLQAKLQLRQVEAGLALEFFEPISRKRGNAEIST